MRQRTIAEFPGPWGEEVVPQGEDFQRAVGGKNGSERTGQVVAAVLVVKGVDDLIVVQLDRL